MSVQEVISVLASLGSLITALVALWAIRSIRHQRSRQYRPDLFIDTYDAHVFGSLLDRELPLRFQRHGHKVNERRNVWLPLKVQNIGLGAAKDIRLLWKFDYTAAIKELRQIAPPGFTFTAEPDKITIHNTRDDYYDILFLDELKEQQLNYILPTQHTERQKDAALPRTAISLYLYYLMFHHNLYQKTGRKVYTEDFRVLPRLQLMVSYRDIADKLYRKSFAFTFYMESAHKHDQHIMGHMFIRVEQKL